MSVDDPSKFADRFSVASPRLPNWNYSSPGIYFITICTLNHGNYFGKIIENKMVLSSCGQITHDELINTIQIRKNISIDPWVIMPNHIHLLITIHKHTVETPRWDVSTEYNIVSTYKNNVSTNIHHPEIAIKNRRPNSIGSIINQFKSVSTKRIRAMGKFFAWQSRFHDEIIKDEKQLIIVKQYIQNNVANWEEDKFYR